ncbi:MAG TPA: hypothetical protein ENI57_12180 [Ignavibacteria bacterium]|nr:hypothetical protein [Ignavibacteria bacterium]
MDKFFEVLIYLFIIVSFINSFLKKKKKKEQKNQKANETPVYQNQTKETDFDVKKEEPSGKDILEEIQTLFNPPINKPKEDDQEAFGELWKTESYKEHYKKDDYHQPTKSEHEMVPGEHSVTLSERGLLEVEKPKDIVVTRLLNNSDDQRIDYQTCMPNISLSQLKDEMRHRDSLKRFIVISEILGKPKALRR